MKYEYCKFCWYFRKFIIISDIKKDSEVFLHNIKNGSKSNGYALKREMVYNCDKHCKRIKDIPYCLDKKKVDKENEHML